MGTKRKQTNRETEEKMDRRVKSVTGFVDITACGLSSKGRRSMVYILMRMRKATDKCPLTKNNLK